MSEPMANWQGAEQVMAEALRLITTERDEKRGAPEKSLRCVAAAWTASLQARGLLDPEQHLTEADVARLYALSKLIRDSVAPERDNRVDGVGYIGILERIEPTR